MKRLGWVGILLVLFVLASSIAMAHSGTYEHNARHRLDRDDKYGDSDDYPRYYGDGWSNNYEYEYHYDDYHHDDYQNDFYWKNYDMWREVYDVDDFDDYESFYWFKKNREYEYDRFEDWFEDEHPWFDVDSDRWEDYLEDWWEDNWDGYVYSRSRGHADVWDSDYYRYDRRYDKYDDRCDRFHNSGCRDRVRVYVDRYDRWDDDYRYGNRYSDYNRGRCGYKYDYYDSYCRDSYSGNWCNDGYYARKYNDQVWYVQACGRVLN
jgi:hypothetical protein